MWSVYLHVCRSVINESLTGAKSGPYPIYRKKIALSLISDNTIEGVTRTINNGASIRAKEVHRDTHLRTRETYLDEDIKNRGGTLKRTYG